MKKEEKRFKILIIDDYEIAAKILVKRLQKRGFETYWKMSGVDCVDFIKEEGIHLVLLDILMPDISGIDVLNNIRKEYAQVEVPVIMVTSKSETEDIVHALNLEANDYLTKPVDIDIAIARINTQLKIVELNADSMKKKELETLNAMITTFNHEINNPLVIAMGNLRKKEDISQENIDKSLNAMKRIAEIVKKIDNLTSGDISKTDYLEDTKMIKLK